jgi:hypothetical protein
MLVWYFLYCIKEACLCYDFMIFVVLLHAKTVVSQFAFTLARVICLSKSFTCQKPPFLLRLQIINITIVLLEKMKSSFCFDHNENGWCVWQKYIILIFFFNWLILFSAKCWFLFIQHQIEKLTKLLPVLYLCAVLWHSHIFTR